MKKFLLFALVLLIGIAFVTTGFAQDKAKSAPEKAPAAEKKAPEKPAAEKTEPAKEEKPAADKPADKPKPKPMAGFVGKVVVTDSVYHTVSVQRGKEIVTFDVTDAKFKGYKNFDQITVGDKISAAYKKGALTVTKIAGAKKEKAAKAEKVAKPKKDKKEAAPADEQKPAEKKPAKAKKAPKAEKKDEKKEEAK